MSAPHELSIGDVYFSPILSVLVLSVIFTWITVMILNRTRIARFIAYPSLTFIAFCTIYLVIIDRFFLQF
ncbi:DUF1656 domain-containing protein [Vibrio rumoiensis]|uniref:DUF1656 domain-containing protein n=1 Tax=Vibrio rumoiensis 1S-45 TaxID=1188252 RepID=A0A1E5E5F8_9VIBR|nr:DUF1656 domain-containing protein [Vibrio rumoiensis]OEF28649.1 hypothetical protein A1QC_05120 [Vibrio rumoiensis 1S-45]